MPIYEYLCEGCGRVSEVMQKVSDPSPKECPECGSTHLAKLVSRSAFQLKGGGWYADLYSSKKKDAKAGDGAAAPAAAAAKPEAKPEAKAEAKPSAPAAPPKGRPAGEP